MTTVIRASSDADFLALVPSLVPDPPRESVVLVAFRHNRTTAALRFSLPPDRSPLVAKRFVTSLLGTVSRLPDADRIVPVVYSDDPVGENGLPRDGLARVLARRLDQAGFAPRDVLCVAADGWGSYFDRSLPAAGRSLSEIVASPVAAEAARLDAERADRRSAPPAPGALARAEFEQRRAVVERGFDHLAEADDDDELPESVRPLVDLPAFLEQALTWEDADFRHWAPLLLRVVQGPPVRDAAMLQWARDESFGRRVLPFDDADFLDAGLLAADTLMGEGSRPDPDRIATGIVLLERLLGHARGRERLPVLCMLTWSHWALGCGSRAGTCLEEAQRIDPGYGMVEVLGGLLASRPLPDWAFGGASAARPRW